MIDPDDDQHGLVTGTAAGTAQVETATIVAAADLTFQPQPDGSVLYVAPPEPTPDIEPSEQ